MRLSQRIPLSVVHVDITGSVLEIIMLCTIYISKYCVLFQSIKFNGIKWTNNSAKIIVPHHSITAIVRYFM